MSPIKLFKSFLIIAAISFFYSSQVAWAVFAPEPESGGKYFRSKGTKSAKDYYYLGRTGTRDSQDYYYGKGLRAGIVTFQPRVSYAREWDNNIHLAPSKKKEDWINRLDWGIDAQAPFEGGKYILFGGVQSQSEWYDRNHKMDHTNWYYNGGGQANFNYFSLSAYEDFRRTSDREGTDFTNFITRDENYLSGLLEVPMSQFFFENEISHYYLKFKQASEELNDRWELRNIPRLGLNVGERTQVLAEYAILPIRYFHETDRDGLSQEWALGMRGFLGKGDLISYQAWGGWENRIYNTSSRKDFRSGVGRADIRYRPSALTELIAEASRRPEESVDATDSYVARNDLGIRYRRKVTDYGACNLGAATGLYDFSGGRDDFFWEAFAKLEYILPGKFASIFGEYRFAQRHSDQSANNYVDNRVNFGLKMEM